MAVNNGQISVWGRLPTTAVTCQQSDEACTRHPLARSRPVSVRYVYGGDRRSEMCGLGLVTMSCPFSPNNRIVAAAQACGEKSSRTLVGVWSWTLLSSQRLLDIDPSQKERNIVAHKRCGLPCDIQRRRSRHTCEVARDDETQLVGSIDRATGALDGEFIAPTRAYAEQSSSRPSAAFGGRGSDQPGGVIHRGPWRCPNLSGRTHLTLASCAIL